MFPMKYPKLKHLRKLKLLSPVPDPSALIILQSNSWWDAILLFAYLPRLKILLPNPYFRRFPWFNGFLDSVQIVPPEPKKEQTLRKLSQQVHKLQNKHNSVCLFFHRSKDNEEIIETYRHIFAKSEYNILFAHGKKERKSKQFLFFRYPHKEISLSFSTEPLSRLS